PRQLVGRGALPELAQLRVAGAIAFAEERRQHFGFAGARIQRRDQRLAERDRAVVGARVAPALEWMQRGNDPTSALGSLVGVERSINGMRDLRKRLAEIEIG